MSCNTIDSEVNMTTAADELYHQLYQLGAAIHPVWANEAIDRASLYDCDYTDVSEMLRALEELIEGGEVTVVEVYDWADCMVRVSLL